MPIVARDPWAMTAGARIDWRAERERIDLAAVATRLLGPAPGRRGERGRALWWPCPFHEDRNPSFKVDPGKPWYRCFGCGAHGNAATLVMHKLGTDFRGALDFLFDRRPAPRAGTAPRPAPPRDRPRAAPPAPAPPRPEAPPEAPAGGLSADEAAALVDDAAARLWSPSGKEARDYLAGRGLDPETIRAARLGYAPRVDARTREGRPYVARGIVIPWHAAGRVVLVKVRQPPGAKPKYAEVYRDRTRPPELYPAPEAVRAGRPLVIVEGEFDALLMGQELADLAAVVTLGSAGAGPDVPILARLVAALPWFIAHDADTAGDKSAGDWTTFPRARRVRPPEGKDWGEFHATGFSRIRYLWAPLLGWRGPTWDELAAPPAPADDTPPEATGDPAADPYALAERHAIQTESDPS